ncbi:MAG: PilW family protein [Ectothiorhodospiraceae bacterium]|nr:PilW family protein [Ectothiorhodospiraceae bacterium]
MNKTTLKYNNKLRGFTLVEIMVAITIGLLMLAGILQISQANKQSNRLQRNMGYVQENIRTAMDLLVRDIQQAGYYEDDNPASPIPITTAPFRTVSAIPTGIITAAITADGGGNANDQITLIYEVSTAPGITTDCLGQAPNATTSPIAGNLFIQNHYFISNQRLMCRGNTGNAQPLVDGVESLQILYGENTDGNPRSANRYVQAQQVTNMLNVVSVRIGMRFISRGAVRATADTTSYALLDAAAFTPTGATDRLLRREITTTISLRNVR